MTPKKRTNMKPEERRAQLLDCAENLFFSRGFEATTVADVLALAGVSKGGFYHHFKSKEELMLGVFDRLAHQAGAGMQALVDDRSRSALDRFQGIYDLQNQHIKTMGIEALTYGYRILMEDANVGLSVLFDRTVARVTIPILTDLIQQGIDEGVFHAKNPEAAASYITYADKCYHPAMLAAIDARGTPEAEKAAALLRATMEATFAATCRVLGIPDGAITFGWPEFVDVLMAAPRLD